MPNKLPRYLNGTGYYVFMWVSLLLSGYVLLAHGGHLMQTFILLPLFMAFFLHYVVTALEEGISVPVYPRAPLSEWEPKQFEKKLFGYTLCNFQVPMPKSYYKVNTPKMPRKLATAIVFLVLPLLPLAALGIFFNDILATASDAVGRAQVVFHEELKPMLNNGLAWAKDYLGIEVDANSLFQQSNKAATIQEALGTLSSWGKTGVTIFETWFATMVFTHAWPKLSKFIIMVIHDHLTPDWMNTIIDRIFGDTGDLLKKWALGQVIIASILSGMLIVLYEFVLGIQYGWAIAIVAGIFGFVPFGVTAGTVIALLVAANQYGFALDGDALFVYGGVIAGTFLIATFEGKVLTPNIQGKQLDIHWLILLFGAIIGLSLGGFAGVFFATPIIIVAKAYFNVLDVDVLPLIKRNPKERRDKQQVLRSLDQLRAEVMED